MFKRLIINRYLRFDQRLNLPDDCIVDLLTDHTQMSKGQIESATLYHSPETKDLFLRELKAISRKFTLLRSVNLKKIPEIL